MYTVFLLLRRKWVQVTKEVAVDIHSEGGGARLADRIRMKYLFLMRDVSRTIPREDQTCAICLDPMEASTATCFCDNHLFHKKCAVLMVQNAARRFGTEFRFRTRAPAIDTRITFMDWVRLALLGSGHISKSPREDEERRSAIYTIDAGEKDTPACPLCRTRPPFFTFTTKVFDTVLGKWCPAEVVWRA